MWSPWAWVRTQAATATAAGPVGGVRGGRHASTATTWAGVIGM